MKHPRFIQGIILWIIITLIFSFSLNIWTTENTQNIPENTKNFIWKTPSLKPVIQNMHYHTMKDEVWTNPESTQEIRKTYKNNPYKIDRWPGTNYVQVYLPTFFHQSHEGFNTFSRQIKELNAYELTIHIFEYSHLEKSDITKLYSSLNSNFSSITFQFYDIPENYDLLFSEFWHNLSQKNVSILSYWMMFPDGFMMDSLIESVDTMLRTNLKKSEFLGSVAIWHEEIWSIYFMLTPEWAKILQNLPTWQLYTKRILIDTMSEPPGDGIAWVKKLQEFFTRSPIENIYLSNVGEKKNGAIKIYGF